MGMVHSTSIFHAGFFVPARPIPSVPGRGDSKAAWFFPYCGVGAGPPFGAATGERSAGSAERDSRWSWKLLPGSFHPHEKASPPKNQPPGKGRSEERRV